nr:MAG TPA: hypothetical protein [Caudoviricetes sp.]
MRLHYSFEILNHLQLYHIDSRGDIIVSFLI